MKTLVNPDVILQRPSLYSFSTYREVRIRVRGPNQTPMLTRHATREFAHSIILKVFMFHVGMDVLT